MSSSGQAASSRIYRVEVVLAETSELRHIWRLTGYDEPNYSYTAAGRELLAKLGSLADAPYHVRTHFLFCSGDGEGRPKWGSTNVCTRDSAGAIRFDWTLWDRIFDAHLDAGLLPFVELGFMPQALSSAPNGVRYDDERSGGWRYPPADYGRWGELIAEAARHSLARYGSRSVGRWYWELWNEPDIFYWAGTPEEYFRLFDVTEAALHAVIPSARLGGPATTNPASQGGARFLRSFLDHCAHGRNAVSGASGTRLDFITFHAKGGGFAREPNAVKSTPTIDALIANVRAGLQIIGEYEKLRDREIILSECDPDGWAAGSRFDNPNLDYRNGSYYASYFATAACRLLDLIDARGPRVEGMLTWAFEFENRGYFEGLRALSTNGLDKPILNAFRLLSRLTGRRARVAITAQRSDAGSDASGARPIAASTEPSISAVASIVESREVQLLLAHHDNDWDSAIAARVTIVLHGLGTARTVRIEECIVDGEHSNAHTEWLKIGSPQPPTAGQLVQLREASRLHRVEHETPRGSGDLSLSLVLRPHAVHLLRFTLVEFS